MCKDLNGRSAVKEIKLTSAVYSLKRCDAKLLLQEFAGAAQPAAALAGAELRGGFHIPEMLTERILTRTSTLGCGSLRGLSLVCRSSIVGMRGLEAPRPKCTHSRMCHKNNTDENELCIKPFLEHFLKKSYVFPWWEWGPLKHLSEAWQHMGCNFYCYYYF